MRPHPLLYSLLPPLLVGGGLALAPLPLVAQPACTALHAGARLCMVDQACTCKYDRGGQLTARPARLAVVL